MITFIFGDSITEGLWDSKGGWADRIKQYIHTEEIKSNIKNYNEVYNLGVDGNFTSQVIERFENEVKARLWEGEENVFIFAIGINDTLHWNNKKFQSSPEKYSEELTALYNLANKYSSKVCFVDLAPVDEDRTNPFAGSSTGKCYTNERIDKFNEVLHSFCSDNNLTLIKINETFKQQDYNSLLMDGLHPNDKGHKLIFENVLPVLAYFLKNKK
jgi:lysophospholipase L1-like esterase